MAEAPKQQEQQQQLEHIDEFNILVGAIKDYNPHADLNLISKAFEFASAAHKGQKRESGEDYITHPIGVAQILTEIKVDSLTIAGALLHDVLEDTNSTKEEMIKEFGQEVTDLVESLTKIDKIHFKTKEDYSAENIRKVVLAMSKDVRVILIKLADRLHNMRTLKSKPEKDRIEKSKETLEIYAPIAYKLGIYKIKAELEDLSMKFLEPEIYQELKEKIAKKKGEREEDVAIITNQITNLMESKGIKARVFGRAKHFYSIYKKMLKHKVGFDEIYDLLAVRIITASVDDCYRALGIIHSTFTPIPSFFEDYIATPKANGYQSIHTKVVYEGRPLEVQIRTVDMHHIAEDGIAAHWRYKETEYDKRFDKKISWLKQILTWKREAKSAKEFIESLKIDLFEHEIVVLTPKGDPVSLPESSTPIDFAYHLHTEIGNTCQKAKVNGVIVSLDHELKSGDIVEILTSKNSSPSRNWLKFAKTSFARAEIRQALDIKGVQREDDSEDFLLAQEILVEDPRMKERLRISRCCNPRFGEEITAFVLKDGRISVHRTNCSNLAEHKDLKRVNVSWPPPKKEVLTLDISATDRLGLLAQILNIIAEASLNVKSINTAERKGHFKIMINVEADDLNKAKQSADRIKKIASVSTVYLHKEQH